MCVGGCREACGRRCWCHAAASRVRWRRALARSEPRPLQCSFFPTISTLCACIPSHLLHPPSPACCPTCSRDYSAAEREKGLHRAILNWASESRSNRGFKEQLSKLSADLTAAAPATAAAV